MMDYALLGIGITLLVALGWVVTALYDLKDRATAHSDHMNAIQRQIAALPVPEKPDTSELADINRRLALLLAMSRASFQRQPEPTPVPEPVIEQPSPAERVVARVASVVEHAKAGRKLIRERLAQRANR
jgi:hypothetical protein